MIKYRALLIVALIFTTVQSSSFAGQVSQPILHIKDFMTPDEARTTGIASLTQVQQDALDLWLTKYTARVMTWSEGPYKGVGSGHWIKSNDGDGTVITLEDGSLWGINEVDQVDTALWLAVTNITVARARPPMGEYQYELINTDDHEEALAKYLGKQ